MSWLQPWAVWFLAGIPLIVLLYLLKVKRRAVTVTTLMFWQRVVQEHRRRALFQRLRSLLSLLLHLLIFALIVGALARPTFDRFVREGASTVVIIDVRARMSAIEGDGETRFAKAIREAAAAVREASSSRQFAILTAGAQTRAIVPFTGNERTLREALQTLEATDAGGPIEPALQLAEELLATRSGSKQVVLLSDRPLDLTTMSKHPGLSVRALGTPRDNVGIVRFAARPLPASPATSEILLEVRNFSVEPVTANVELRYDDRLLDVKPVSMAAGGKETLVFPSVPRPGAGARGHFTASLARTDSLAIDNIARVWLPPPRPIRTLLLTQGNVFLEKALSADPGLSYELLSPEAWSESIAAKFDVVVLDRFLPDRLPPVNLFHIQRTPFDSGATPLESPPLTDIDLSHPTLRLLDFSQTMILRALPLTLPAPTADWSYVAPLRTFDHALFVVGEKRAPKAQRVAALGLDLTATDLPLRVAFPLLITNTVQWLAGVTADAPTALSAGETLPLGAEDRIATDPPLSGSFQPIKNGFYPLTRAGRSEWLAVNTFDPAESDLRFSSDAAAAPTGPRAISLPEPVAGLTSWPVWRYLAFAALALFTLEWSLFHRRQTE